MKLILKQKVKKIVVMSMAFSMLFCNNVLAAPVTDTLDNTTGTDHFEDELDNIWDSGEITERVEVSISKSSEFTITIPKEITLDGETGKADYVVNAKGDISGNQVLSIVPDSTFNE